jgi:3-deoxy-D-manno-octulosonic-acid transferase
VHAASIGEVLSCMPIVARLQQAGFGICLSTGTQTGYAAAVRHLPKDAVFYLPLDYAWCVRCLLQHIDPGLVLINEIEIWPIFARCVKEMGIPLIMINGRMPEKDFRRFHLLRFFYSRVLSRYDGLFMQGDSDAERMQRICNHGNLRALGQLKFDVPQARLAPLLAGLLPAGFTICAASTHPDDEQMILEAFRRMYSNDRDLCLIIAPISMSRTKKIARLAANLGLGVSMRSENRRTGSPVFILDSSGELSGIYARCNLVIMGGTFSKRTGGHNIIEPAVHGKCILCGPHMGNFQDVYDIFRTANALQLTTKENLAADLVRLAADPQQIQSIGQRAQTTAERHRGAAERIYEALREYLP